MPRSATADWLYFFDGPCRKTAISYCGGGNVRNEQVSLALLSPSDATTLCTKIQAINDDEESIISVLVLPDKSTQFQLFISCAARAAFLANVKSQVTEAAEWPLHHDCTSQQGCAALCRSCNILLLPCGVPHGSCGTLTLWARILSAPSPPSSSSCAENNSDVLEYNMRPQRCR